MTWTNSGALRSASAAAIVDLVRATGLRTNHYQLTVPQYIILSSLYCPLEGAPPVINTTRSTDGASTPAGSATVADAGM